MSMKHLGERFDIHTGGNDNKFPHHEDEIAQSEGYTGRQVVSTWVHGGFLRLSGQKIAKSAKNVILVPELEERGIDPLAFRLLCFGTRYRSEMDFSWEALEGANARLRHLRQRMVDWTDGAAELSAAAKELDRRFRDAVADDLDMPQALVVLSDVDTGAPLAVMDGGTVTAARTGCASAGPRGSRCPSPPRCLPGSWESCCTSTAPRRFTSR